MKPSPISDDTRALAALLWSQFPRMKPVGEARQKRHLIELEALRAAGVTEGELVRSIHALSSDRYRRMWVSDFGQIAEHLPQIRAHLEAMTPPKPVRSESFVSQWRKGERV